MTPAGAAHTPATAGSAPAGLTPGEPTTPVVGSPGLPVSPVSGRTSERPGAAPIPEGETGVGVALRFWVKVAIGGPGECWPWLAASDKAGYGGFWLNGGQRRAPRVAWLLAHPGEGIPPGVEVRHDCDNPPCVNPGHLRLGTAQDNALDRIQRGRTATGDRNGSRLHPEKLRRGERAPGYQPDGCRNGHDASRRYVSASGERRCTDCLTARSRRARAKARAEVRRV